MLHAPSDIARVQPEISTPAKAERISSCEYVVRGVKNALHQGVYVPGQQLTEAELTSRFGVGRASVREALKRLDAEGVVKVSLHRGARVTTMTRADTQEALEIIESLGALAVRRAAGRALSEAETRKLVEMIEALASARNRRYAPDDDPRHLFFQFLAELSGSKQLQRVLDFLRSDWIRFQYRPTLEATASKQIARDYKRVLEAVLAQDAATAERTMRKHFRSIAKVVDSLPDTLFGY